MKVRDVVRTSKFINWKVAKKIPDLMLTMAQSRVAFIVEDNGQHYDNIEQNFRHLIREFCEDNNHGLWTYQAEGCFFDHDNNVVDPNSRTFYDEDLGSQVIFNVFFEHAADADTFVKNFLVLYKLSN